MAYVTQQDLIDRFGLEEIRELSDRNDTGVIDAAVVSRAIGDVQAQIDSYIGARYTLPLTVVPEVLKRVACDLTRYQLYDIKVPDNVETRYQEHLKFLADVSKGTATLGTDTSNTEPQASAGGVKYAAPDRIFNANTLQGY